MYILNRDIKKKNINIRFKKIHAFMNIQQRKFSIKKKCDNEKLYNILL